MKSSLVLVVLGSLGCLFACSGAPPEASSESASSIVGGMVTAAHPSVGYLVEPGADHHHCTGTLIAPNVVLSAAHCWDGPAQLDFGVGTFSADASTKRYRAVERADGAFARVHPAYDGKSNDIAYVVLDEPVESTRPATIGAFDASCDFEAVGYGRDTPGANDRADGFDDQRKKATVCITGRAPQSTYITAKGKGGTTCVGDSGGGLMSSRRGGDVLVAVVHGGVACEVGAEMYFQPVSTESEFIAEALEAGRVAMLGETPEVP